MCSHTTNRPAQTMWIKSSGPNGLDPQIAKGRPRRNKLGRDAQDTLRGNTELLAVVRSSSIPLDADLPDEGDQLPAPMRIPWEMLEAETVSILAENQRTRMPYRQVQSGRTLSGNTST